MLGLLLGPLGMVAVLLPLSEKKSATKECPRCHSRLNPELTFCGNCGFNFEVAEILEKREKRLQEASYRTVVCEGCSTRYKIDERRLTKEKNSVRCTKCGNIFVVEMGWGVEEEAGVLTG